MAGANLTSYLTIRIIHVIRIDVDSVTESGQGDPCCESLVP